MSVTTLDRPVQEAAPEVTVMPWQVAATAPIPAPTPEQIISAMAVRGFVVPVPATSPPTQPNEAFIREVLAYIEIHPETWHQSWWARKTDCGTSHCIAGWAYTLATGKPFTVNHVPDDLLTVAADALGMPLGKAWELFHFTGIDDHGHGRHPTFEELCHKVQELTGVRFKPTPKVPA